MHSIFTKRLLVAALAAVLCFSLTGCGKEAAQADEGVQDDEKTFCAAGGEIIWPEGLLVPGEKNTMVKDLVDGTLAGAFSLTNYRSTGYYYTSGDSLTITVKAELDTVTKYTDACFSLWERGDNYSEYLGVIYFKCDGTAQSYTWSGLKPNTEYKVNFTYTTIPTYLMSGTFNVDGFSSEAAEDTTVVAE